MWPMRISAPWAHLPILQWAAASHDGGAADTQGSRAKPWGCFPFLLFHICCIPVNLTTASAIDIFPFFSWLVSHSCGSAQGIVSNICGAALVLDSFVHKMFCSAFL